MDHVLMAAPVRLVYTVDCRDAEVAHRIEELFPSLDDLLSWDGVTGLSAEYIVEHIPDA